MKCPKCKGVINKETHICEGCGVEYVKMFNKYTLRSSIFLFVTSIFLFIGSFFELRAFSYNETTAFLVSYSQRSTSDEYGTYYHATFEYTVDGKKYEAKMDVKPEERKKGLEKKIYYNPNNPEKYYRRKSVGVLVICGGIALISLIGSIFMFKDSLKPLTFAEAEAMKKGKSYDEAKKEVEYQESLKSLEVPFPLFNKIVYIEYEDERITEEYEQHCRSAFSVVSNEQFKELLNQTRKIYEYQRDNYLTEYSPEEYEAEGMIKDEDLDNDNVLIQHLIPRCFFPIYNETGDIFYAIEINTTWDHWDNENGIIWVFKNDKVGAFEIESDWENKIDVN
jgi:hypothetical protein